MPLSMSTNISKTFSTPKDSKPKCKQCCKTCETKIKSSNCNTIDSTMKTISTDNKCVGINDTACPNGRVCIITPKIDMNGDRGANMYGTCEPFNESHYGNVSNMYTCNYKLQYEKSLLDNQVSQPSGNTSIMNKQFGGGKAPRHINKCKCRCHL